MRQLNLVLLFIAGAAILSTTLYFQLFAGEHPWESPTYLPASDEDELICAPGARYLDPKDLMTGLSVQHQNDPRIPRLIHQSWIDKDLPVKFSKWSDTLRLRHPEWRWVLWTDADNAELVSSRHPHLNETYWALRNNIQRADFVRNLYMWEFGGVYADLDMECLRPLDSLFSPPFNQINPSYPTLSSSIPHDAALAFVGSMEGPAEMHHHTMPNAFMASTPRHPLWLLPMSRVLTDYHADREGKAAQADYSGTAESTTGPEALLHSVETYRAWRGESRPSSTEVHVETSTIFHQTIAHLVPESAVEHEVIVLDTSIIYPFSWLGDVESEEHQTCRAAPGMPFDPIRCQEVCKAYERGARMITYWTHTWKQKGEHKDLDVVGY